MTVVLQASALWWMIVICFLMGALTCQGIAGWLCTPQMHQMTLVCHKGTFLIYSKLPLLQVVILELPHLTNTMTNIYVHKVMHFLTFGLLYLQSVAGLFI